MDLEQAKQQLGAVALDRKPTDRTKLDPAKLHLMWPAPVYGGGTTPAIAAAEARGRENTILGWYGGVEAGGKTLEEVLRLLNHPAAKAP